MPPVLAAPAMPARRLLPPAWPNAGGRAGRRQRCRRSGRPSSSGEAAVQRSGRRCGAGASSECRRVGPGEAGDAAGCSALSSVVVGAVGEGDEGAAEVAVLVEAVDRGGRRCRSVRPGCPSRWSSSRLVKSSASLVVGATPLLAKFAASCGRSGRLREASGRRLRRSAPRLFSATVGLRRTGSARGSLR